MGRIKASLDVDLYVDSRPMTEEDEKAIRDYIKADKLKRSKKTGRKKTTKITLPKVSRKNEVST